MKKDYLISILVPVFSVLLIAGVYFFIEPSTTGLAIYSANESTSIVNANVVLETKSGEVIPPDAYIEVWLDHKKARMTITEFIQRTGKEYDIQDGELLDFGFQGKGFTGQHSYNLTLADFNIDRNIGNGEHVFITRIIYRNQVLYEKENRIMIN
jgi:hypothetical protein